ncbi:hypothetical protein [Alloactinosynnema sp. L-07]|nr:hypothetical protein [Alloactinosynnema sp. L-07]
MPRFAAAPLQWVVRANLTRRAVRRSLCTHGLAPRARHARGGPFVDVANVKPHQRSTRL